MPDEVPTYIDVCVNTLRNPTGYRQWYQTHVQHFPGNPVRDNLRCTFPIALHGQYFSKPISSFLAEAIALDEAIDYFSKLICK